MPGREDYEERRQARIDRLREAGSRACEKASNEYKKSNDLVSGIPLGQPNIIGRPALPRLRERSMKAMDRALEHNTTAAYYAEKAEAAEGNGAISSDDPQALNKLMLKLEKLETERERIKKFNREAKKNGTEKAPWYALPYLSKDIKAVKDRIAQLEQVDAMPAELIEFDDGEIESDPTSNRIMIRFNQRQDDDMTTKLKRNGFHWSPASGAWQRMRNKNALLLAIKICGVDLEEADR